jgi:hypothetical protein
MLGLGAGTKGLQDHPFMAHNPLPVGLLPACTCWQRELRVEGRFLGM